MLVLLSVAIWVGAIAVPVKVAPFAVMDPLGTVMDPLFAVMDPLLLMVSAVTELLPIAKFPAPALKAF